MPDVLNVLVAFVAEHQRCGDPDGGVDNGYAWLISPLASPCPKNSPMTPLRSSNP